MKTILCFGDSNTWGYDYAAFEPGSSGFPRLPFDARWPGVLQGILGGEWRVIEDGLPSRTNMAEDFYLPHRKGLDGLEVALEVHAPLDLVIIHTGVNELKDMFCLSAGMVAFGAEMLVNAVLRPLPFLSCPPPNVLLIAPPPVRAQISDMSVGNSFGPQAYAKSCELGKLYKDVAERLGCGFIDCADLDFELNDFDGLHYSRKDHAKLGAAAAKKAAEMLGR